MRLQNEIIPSLLFLQRSDNAHATGSKLLEVVIELVLLLFGLIAGAEPDEDTGHTLGNVVEFARRRLMASYLCTVVDGLGGLRVEEPDSSASTASFTESLNHRSIIGVLAHDTGSIGDEQDDVGGEKGAVISTVLRSMVSLLVVSVTVWVTDKEVGVAMGIPPSKTGMSSRPSQ